MRFAAYTTLASTLALAAITGCKHKQSEPKAVNDLAATAKEQQQQNAQEAGTLKAESPADFSRQLEMGKLTLEYNSPYKATKDVAQSNDLKATVPETVDVAYYSFELPAREGRAAYTYFSYNITPSLDGAMRGILNGYKGMTDVQILSDKTEDVSQQVGLPAKMAKGILSINMQGRQKQGQFVHMVIQSENDIVIFQGLFEQPDNQASKSFQKTLQSLTLTQNQ